MSEGVFYAWEKEKERENEEPGARYLTGENGERDKVCPWREPKSCLGRVFNSKLGHIATLTQFVPALHAGTSKVENSALGPSCQLKFVHGGMLRVQSCFILSRVRPPSSPVRDRERERERKREREKKGGREREKRRERESEKIYF